MIYNNIGDYMNSKFLNEYKNLGLSIAYFRKARGLTQQKIADEMNVSYETISRIENASTGITFDMLLELSKAIDIPLNEIFKHANI